MVVHPSVWFFLYHTFQFDEMYVGFWEKGVSQSTWRKTSWCREKNQQQTQAKYTYNGIDGRNRNPCHIGRSGVLLFLHYACTFPQRIPPLTCFSFFSLDGKPSLTQIEKTDCMEGYALIIVLQLKGCCLIFFVLSIFWEKMEKMWTSSKCCETEKNLIPLKFSVYCQ